MAVPNPDNLTFPYPEQGTVVRPPGEGCQSCVHQKYCVALYWLRRNGSTFKGDNQTDENIGRACLEWSNDPVDEIKVFTEDDLKHVDRVMIEGIGKEPTSGEFDDITGSSHN